jgi:hypothetical protein
VNADRVRPWLVALVAALVAELVWGVVRWGWFLVRRTAVREEIKEMLIGRTESKRNGRRAAAVVALVIVALGIGCSAVPETQRGAPQAPIMRAEDLNFNKATDTVAEILFPVYGTSAPPWDTLNETLLEADPQAGRHILEVLAEFIVP